MIRIPVLDKYGWGGSIMKVIKRIQIFLLMMVLSIGFMVMPVLAASLSQDGLEVTLTTDKESYSQDDQIVATLTVTNTNDFAVSHVSLENVIPEGYKLADGSEVTKQVESLESGESATLTVTYVTDSVNDNESDPSSGNNAGNGENSGAGTGNNSGSSSSGSNAGNTNSVIATGDNSNIMFWGLLLVMVSAGIITILILKKKNGKKLLYLLLCVTMVGSLVTGVSTKVYAEESNSSHINIEHIIVVDGEELSIRGIVNYNNIQSTDPSDDSVINLSASKTEYSLSEDGTIYFYAEVNCESENVSLIDAETEEVLLELVDDGKYSESGDDLPGDNIYTAKAVLDTSFENEYSFYAVTSSEKEFISNTITVVVYSNFTDEELSDMDKVDEMFQTELFSAEKFDSMTIEERKEIADFLFEEMIVEGLIEEDSVLYDEETQSYTFVYSADALGSLIIKNWNGDQNGNAGDPFYFDEITDAIEGDNSTEENIDNYNIRYKLTQVISDDNTADESSSSEAKAIEDAAGESNKTVPEETIINERENAISTYGFEDNAIATYADAGEDYTIGNAVILWSFDQAWDDASFRRPFYEQTENDWEAKGLDVTVNYDTTVEDYKNLEGYDVICFSGHGAYNTYKTGIFGINKTTVPSLLLHEKSTWSKNWGYSADLKAFRIGKMSVQGGTMYAILPNFFTHYYSTGDLDGSFVFVQDCESFGKNGTVDYSMANAIRSASAESVIGYHNSVESNYGRNFMKAYVDNLIDGATTLEAYDAAILTQGANDYFTGREQLGPTAYPIFVGNVSSSMINAEIMNGNFEEANTPVEWNQVGDTRVINKLGSIVPYKNQKMAILTTGIGSAENDYLAGTEGSVLSQAVKIPENTKSLAFSYDFVSEEPMEYVGSSFNDTFAVQIISESGVETILTNDVNTATWYEISGIDFDGGDSTTYHTEWKNEECDISKYAGQVVTIRFMVYDVGDSIYDSAVLLDAVSLK